MHAHATPAQRTFARVKQLTRTSDTDEDEDDALLRTAQQGGFRTRTVSFPGRTAAKVTPPCESRSKRPRVLVTGGAGFIGSHVSRALLARGEDVVIVDELNNYYDPKLKLANLRSLLEEFGQARVHTYVADICDAEAMQKCYEAERFDRIIHLAARAGVRPSLQDPHLYERSNVQGTLTLLELAKRAGGAIKHFVYASSSSVYGDDAPVPFTELDPCNTPVSIYAATKKSCELLASSYAHLYQLPCSGMRFFTVYGECLEASTLVAVADDRRHVAASELRHGDQLVGQDGAVVTITNGDSDSKATLPVEKTNRMYKITYGRDGYKESYTVTPWHLVTLRWNQPISMRYQISNQASLSTVAIEVVTMDGMRKAIGARTFRITSEPNGDDASNDFQGDHPKEVPHEAEDVRKSSSHAAPRLPTLVADSREELEEMMWEWWATERRNPASEASKYHDMGDLLEVPAEELHNFSDWYSGDQTDRKQHDDRLVTGRLTTLPSSGPVPDSIEPNVTFTGVVPEGGRVSLTHAASQTAVRDLGRLAMPQGDYQDVSAGMPAKVVFMLQSAESTTKSPSRSKAPTLMHLEHVMQTLQLPLGLDGGLVITELNGKINSKLREYDAVCRAQMHLVLQELGVSDIVAFGFYASWRWKNDAVNVTGVSHVRHSSVGGVDFVKLRFTPANQDDVTPAWREVTVWCTRDPCREQNLSHVMSAVGRCYGIDVPLQEETTEGDRTLTSTEVSIMGVDAVDGESEYVSVEVDGNHRFALANGILTHNCGRRDMAPFIFTDRLARGVPITQFGDGTTERDYTFIDDIVQGVVKVLDHVPTTPASNGGVPTAAHEVYNLGFGSPISLANFIQTIARELGVTPTINIQPKQPGDVDRTFADTSKARRMLGYAPKVSVQDGIRRFVKWYLATHPPQPKDVIADSALSPCSSPTAPLDSPVASESPSTLSLPFPPLASCLCATRIHNQGSTRIGLSPDMFNHLLIWLPRALACAQHVAIAVDTTDNKRDIYDGVAKVLLGLTPSEQARVSIVAVSPWQAFVPALNALLAHAQSKGCATILYSSLEMQMHPAHIHTLRAHLKEDTLVVGARLSGHRFVRGAAVIDGCSTVWNTLALWCVPKLLRTGFLTISDGLPARDITVNGVVKRLPPVSGGVEEVVCVSAQQALFPTSAQAKLLSMTTHTNEEWTHGEHHHHHTHHHAAYQSTHAAHAGTTSAASDETDDSEEREADADQGEQLLYDDIVTSVTTLDAAGRPVPHAAGMSSVPRRPSLSVVSHHSHLRPPTTSASSMKRIPSLFWDADFGGDADREAAHEKKMRSKLERAQQQLDEMQLRPGTVQHIHVTIPTQ